MASRSENQGVRMLEECVSPPDTTAEKRPHGRFVNEGMAVLEEVIHLTPARSTTPSLVPVVLPTGLQEVMQLRLDGLTPDAIAARLQLAPAIVSERLDQIRACLRDLQNRLEDSPS